MASHNSYRYKYDNNNMRDAHVDRRSYTQQTIAAVWRSDVQGTGHWHNIMPVALLLCCLLQEQYEF
jgi:hypothetical protein